MPKTEIQPESLRAAAQKIPADSPVFMLNLLRYHETADYGGRSDLPPCTGREAYFARYAPAFYQAAAGIEVKVAWKSGVLAHVLSPAGEQWDEVAIIEYPSFAAFRQVVESPWYKENAEPHRLAALADLRLIATAKEPV